MNTVRAYVIKRAKQASLSSVCKMIDRLRNSFDFAQYARTLSSVRLICHEFIYDLNVVRLLRIIAMNEEAPVRIRLSENSSISLEYSDIV